MKKKLKTILLFVAMVCGASQITNVSAQGIPLPSPFYRTLVNCSDYSNYPGCDGLVYFCDLSGDMDCEVLWQVPCSLVCV